ncbi:Dyp-type peroxidase [Leucobacter allii]|uniref:Dyp-type peroxidase n=1 Tax=Leucobacter allii TaxID=2932247 RepID=UPI001FD55FC3|nr:Dyp-type peroxidase [Leucobacter allii]UOR02118.1 Dyp-type peroxidase [Leucobacter allii]
MPAEDAAAPEPAPARGTSRRGVLLAGLGGLVAGAAGTGLAVAGVVREADGAGSAAREDQEAPGSVPAGPEPVDPHGARQAGIARPAAPQPQALFLVFSDVPGLGPWLGELGEAITALCAEGDGLLDGPGDLSVTVGVGPALIAAFDPAAAGAEALPAFAGDDALAADRRRGDVCLQICGSDPVAIELAAERLSAVTPGRGSFRQRAFRPPGEGTIVRSPLGFHDGIAIPRGEAELAESVFIGDGPSAGGSVWVIRQFALDIAGFRGLPLGAREAAVGRRESDGAPLSGGTRTDDVALGEKREDGEYLVPAAAHARRAHPSFTGSGLMLRRSYSYDNGADDRGLVFVSFQNELRTFVATQRRLDEADAMLAFATPRASFVFLALPGFDAGRPLGAAYTRS